MKNLAKRKGRKDCFSRKRMEVVGLPLEDGLEISDIHDDRLNGSCERGAELKFVTFETLVSKR